MRSFTHLLLLAAVLAPGPLLLPAWAQDPPAADPYLPDLDRLDCQEPPLQVRRPDDSWTFVDLAVLEQQARQKGEDTSGYRTLRARLWHGASRSSIFVRTWGWRGREAPTPAELGESMLAEWQASLADPRVRARGTARVGRREGYVFEVEGSQAGSGERLHVMQAVVHRPEDNQVLVIALETTAEDPRPLKKDLLELLKKVRF